MRIHTKLTVLDISGVPGTGKTATVHRIVRELKRMAERNASITSIYYMFSYLTFSHLGSKPFRLCWDKRLKATRTFRSLRCFMGGSLRAWCCERWPSKNQRKGGPKTAYKVLQRWSTCWSRRSRMVILRSSHYTCVINLSVWYVVSYWWMSLTS